MPVSSTHDGGKVFGIGLSKTGTSSLTAALDILGIRSIHFPHDDRTFDELRRGQYRLSILDEFQSATDTPIAPFYAQLDRAWPGSKFILTVRERASWLRSAEAHWRVLKEGPRAHDAQFQAFVDFVNACVYGCTHFNAERFAFAYELHCRNVLEYFAARPRELLVLDICGGAGWPSLCAFLGVPEPAGVPFPHANRASRWKHMLVDAGRELRGAVPEAETLILIDDNALDERVRPCRRVLPFLERGGQYWGPPPDSEVAIAELERMRSAEGATFLAVAWPALWWLDCYDGFAAHVRTAYRCVIENERLVVFDLRALRSPGVTTDTTPRTSAPAAH